MLFHFQMMTDLRNPWAVESIMAFNYFLCPECDFHTKTPPSFENHAMQNHPRAKPLFSNEQTDQSIVKDEDQTSVDNFIQEALEDENTVKDDPESFYFGIDMCDEVEDHSVPEDFEDQNDQLEGNQAENLKEEKCIDKKEDIIPYMQPEEVFDENKDIQKIHKCSKCSESFGTLVDLAYHSNSAHSKVGGKHQCPSCIKSFANSTKLRIHIETVHEKKKVKCPVCESIVLKHGLRNHMAVSHQGDRVNKPFKCELCDFQSHAKKYLKAHIFNCHEKEKYQFECDQCNKKFPFPHVLREHKEVEHDGIKRFMCHKCGKGFLRKTMFDEHVMKDTCDSSANRNSNPEPVKCEECNETFSGRRYFVQHYRAIHGGLPPDSQGKEQFMCDQCPNVYISQLSLKMHIKTTHSGKLYKPAAKKDRKCPHCDKMFTTLTSYKEHLKVKHENSTPYKCDQCHRSYGTKSRLKVHKRNMHQRIKCDECGQEICNTFILKRHKATVHGTRPTDVFQCDYCPLFYNRKSALDKHLLKHHPVINP